MVSLDAAAVHDASPRNSVLLEVSVGDGLEDRNSVKKRAYTAYFHGWATGTLTGIKRPVNSWTSVAAKMPRLTKLLWEHRTASRIPEVAFLVVLLSEEKTPLRDSVKQSCHFTASAYEIRSSLALSNKGT